jgi:hypothetical protein
MHLVWENTKLESLPGSFSQFFVVSTHQNAPMCEQPSSEAHFRAKTKHPCASCKSWYFIEQLGD